MEARSAFYGGPQGITGTFVAVLCVGSMRLCLLYQTPETIAGKLMLIDFKAETKCLHLVVKLWKCQLLKYESIL